MRSEESIPVPTSANSAECALTPWFGDLNPIEFEIEFFERVLARSPDDVSCLRALGELLARKGLWERSLKVEERLIALRPRDGIAHYNLACSLAMQGAQTEAIDALAKAIDVGYRDFGHLEVDPDLDGLRHLPAYRALLRQYRRAPVGNNL
jgi:tetratricopeptide (TPR) repeat protein